MPPAAAVAAGAAVVGGVAQIAGAIIGQDGQPVMDPVIAAAIESGKLDLAQYAAEVAAAQWGIDTGWKQNWTKYDAELRQALEADYAQNWSSADTFAKKFIERVSKGEPTEATVNLLSSQKAIQGRQKSELVKNQQAQLAASGLSPDSPAYMEIMGKLQGDIAATETASDMNLLSQKQSEDQAMMPNLLAWASDANRLRGANFQRDAEGNLVLDENGQPISTGPDIPQTEEEKFAADQQEQLASIDEQIAALEQEMTGLAPGMESRFRGAAIRNKIAGLKRQRETVASSEFQWPGGEGVETTTNRPLPTWEDASPDGGYELGTQTEGQSRSTNALSTGAYAEGRLGGQDYRLGRNSATSGSIRTNDPAKLAAYRTNYLTDYYSSTAGRRREMEQPESVGLGKYDWRVESALRQERVLNPQFKPDKNWYQRHGVKV